MYFRQAKVQYNKAKDIDIKAVLLKYKTKPKEQYKNIIKGSNL